MIYFDAENKVKTKIPLGTLNQGLIERRKEKVQTRKYHWAYCTLDAENNAKTRTYHCEHWSFGRRK